MQGHIAKIKLYVFLFTSFIYSFETINILLDPISHNVFYLDSVCPIYQPDLLNKNYIIAGDIGYAMSVYMLEDLYSNINDSVRTNSSLLYKWGDFGYRDITFDVKTRVSGNGILKFIGNGLSYPGRTSQYAGGNILQNYLLHFSKDFGHSDLAFYTGYHLENKDLEYINSNSGESYASGISYNISREKYLINLQYAFQIGEADSLNLKNYHIVWGEMYTQYNLTKNITPYIYNLYKEFHRLYGDPPRTYINNLSAGLKANFNLIDFDIALYSFLSPSMDSDFNLQVTAKTTFKSFNILGGFLNQNWLNIHQYKVEGYKYYFSKISYQSDILDIALEPRYVYYNSNTYWGLNSKLNINYNIFHSSTKIIPYLLSLDKTKILLSMKSNYYHTSEFLLKNHINLSLRIFEINSQKRYKKFFGFSYNGIQFNESYLMDLDQIDLYYKGNWDWSNNSLKNYLDFYVGVEFKKFIFSWHFTNILDTDYLINKDGNIKDFDMKYFTVKWKFDN